MPVRYEGCRVVSSASTIDGAGPLGYSPAGCGDGTGVGTGIGAGTGSGTGVGVPPIGPESNNVVQSLSLTGSPATIVFLNWVL